MFTTHQRIVALALLASALATGQALAAAKPAACPPTKAFTTKLDHLEGYRLVTGPDGDSKVEPYRIDARIVPLLTTGRPLAILDLLKAPKREVGIVVGPADVELPMHPAPYPEMFILLGGSFVLKTANASIPMEPGSVLLFEDVDAKIGHGGRIGPCGYVSLSIAP